MDPTPSTSTGSPSYIPPLKQPRRNFRLIVLLSVAALPFLVGIVYPMVDYKIHGGIHHHEAYDEVDLRALGYFPFDGVNGTIQEVPPQWRALDGKRIQLTGCPWAPRTAAGRLTEFEFVYNINKCCFNGPPLVQERVYAVLRPGQTVPAFDVGRLTGILHVKINKNEAGLIASVYTLDVEKAEAGQ